MGDEQVDGLSEAAQNSLKTIWSLGEWSEEPVTAAALAEALGLRRSTVSDGLKRLRGQGLVEHAPYGTVRLTETGRATALVMVRRHRLIETFLVRTLGYRWDQVHDEAEALEHAVSDFMVERMAAVLGHPERDPHGDPIPAADGTVTRPDARPLPELLADPSARRRREAADGLSVTVARISDADPAVLRDLAAAGIGVGTRMRVPSAPETGGVDDADAAGRHADDRPGAVAVRLAADAGRHRTLAREAAAALYVSLS
ncbi:Iron-dependent repressor IdeR [Rothia kristinae]|uniref:metal-dependent transcriptional regulator n=1 Tax=Rothia kristinae TaxID=37923 RepID=UPI0007737FE6|nr:metal-dependent transcriptional regulator [Rothia kristinae]SQC30244.1 Iron-dependent repressor IdeR [Rothia kristinae]